METIIVQETNAAILDILTIALQMADFEVFAVTEADGNFLDLIDQVRPHVVVLMSFTSWPGPFKNPASASHFFGSTFRPIEISALFPR
jgi:hypothetical protein